MKRFIFLLFVGLITSFIIVSCNNKEDKIIGKWPNVLMVVKSTEGMYTTDMTKYPPTYNVFKKDNTLQITSGKFKENVQYFIQNDQLFSLRPGESSPSIMDINKLTKDELILNLKYHDQYQKEVTLYYKRVE